MASRELYPVAVRSCPACGRSTKLLRCIAVVFGRRFLACGRVSCRDHQRTHAEAYVLECQAGARGNTSIAVMTWRSPRRTGIEIMAPEALDHYRKSFLNAIRMALDPWGSLRDQMGPLMGALSYMRAQKDDPK